MITLALVGAWFTSVVIAAVTGVPDWASTGISSAFLSALWWQERRDRQRAEERERDIMERAILFGDKMTRAAELLEAFIHGQKS